MPKIHNLRITPNPDGGQCPPYMTKYQYFGSPKLDIAVEQGVEMGRSSLLYLRAEYTPTRCPVIIGGRVINIAKGEFIL